MHTIPDSEETQKVPAPQTDVLQSKPPDRCHGLVLTSGKNLDALSVRPKKRFIAFLGWIG